MQTAEEAQQRAAVMGLFLVAGDRRMDRILPVSYRSMWKTVEDSENARKSAEEERKKQQEERKQRDERKQKREEEKTQVFMSQELISLVEKAIKCV
jgi:hypothetical protein